MASELIAPPSSGSMTALTTRFDALATRIRRLALLRGLGRLIFLGAILCGLGLLADWVWILPQSVRLGWLAVTGIALSYTLWTAVLRPVLRNFTMAELAAIVESEYPELGERLTSAVELTNPNIPEADKGSALMREYLEAETLRSTEHLDFRKSVPSDQARKWSLTGLIAGAVLLLPFLLMSSGYGQLWARFLTPWSLHELPAELFFQVPDGDRVVARGEDLTLLALPPKDVDPEDLPEAVELVYTTPTGETDRRPMEYVADQNGYLVTLPHVFEGFEYVITAKRKRSDRHTITVVDRPEITAFTLKITPPNYTGYPVRSVDGAVGDVEVFERSQIEATLEFNKPLAKAEWIWEAANAEDGGKLEAPIALPFQLSEDGKSAQLELLAANGWFAARVQDEHGLTNIEEPARHLRIIADQPPKLNLSGQIVTSRARKDDVITLTAVATDDFGISALELHIETLQEETIVQAVPEEELGPNEVTHVFQLDLAELKLDDGDGIKYRVRAADNRPLPGPQEVWSEERRIIIDPNAELPGTQEVKQRQGTLREILNAIRKDVQETQEAVEKLREDAEAHLTNNNGKPFDRQGLLTQLEQKQTELSDRLEELATQFAAHRLFGNLTPETQRIARDPLKSSTEQLQKAQTQNELTDKAESLKQSANALANADQDLEKLAGRFDELAALEQDLLVIPRLAQQADRVAEQALDLANRRENPPAEETAEQKEAREAELDHHEAALAEERQNLADRLDELLDHRPEVLAAARKSALEQIADLSKQAAGLAERQEALTDALKADAEETAKAAAPIAEHQEDLLKTAEKLEASSNKTAPQADAPQPVKPLDPEELRKVLEELKAGNLDAAAEKQKALADRLEALADELKKNKQLPADPQQAAQQLADREKELQQKIAEAAQNAPSENASEDEKQKFENTLRKLAEQQTGIQAGIAQLNPPTPSQKDHQTAAERAAGTVQELLKQDPEKAAEKAQQTAEALEQLAKNIGTPQERQAQTAEAVETLRKKQQELKNEVAKAIAAQPGDEKPSTEELAQKQKDLAERLAQQETPNAEQAKREAIQQSVAALKDLEKEQLQDAEATQAQAEQALADLAKQIAGQPTSREQVENLQKRQQEINEQAKTAVKDSDPNPLAQQATAQKEQADELQKLETPAAERERQAAEQAAKAAAEELAQPKNGQQTQAALEKAAATLEQLQKALAPRPNANPAQQAETLAKQQSQSAETAKAESQNAQQKQALPPAEARQKQQDELAQLTEDTKRLQAGKEAEPQKQQALEALQKAEEAQERLEELIKKKEEKPPADQPETKPAPPQADEELQRLIQENADAQKDAAEALDKLQQELAKKENQEKLHNEMNEIEEQAEKLAQENPPAQKPQPPALPQAEEVEKLAQEARAVEEEIEQLKQEQAGLGQEQVAQAEQREQPKAEQPNQPAPPNEPGAPQANNSQPNPQDPKNSDPNPQPANAQDPKDSRPKDSATNPSDPNNSQPNASDPKDTEPNGSRPEQSPAPPQEANQQPPGDNSPAPMGMNPENAPGTEPNAENPQKGTEPKPGETSNQNGQPANPQRAEDSANKQPTAGQSLTERQAEMARKSAELALEVARDQGAKSAASQQAAEAARKANQANAQTRDGVLDQAAKTAQEAANAAKAAAEELAKNPADPNQDDAAKLAQEAQNQADAQSAIAQELAEAAADPTRRQAAQQAGQKALAEATEQLTKELEQAARELTSQPLDLEQPGDKTKAAGEATGQATQEMKQAQSNAARGNAAKAARSAEEAAQALRQAAGEAPAPPEDTPENTLVPGDLAEKVTDARRQLEEARQLLRDNLKPQNSTQSASGDNSQAPESSEPQPGGEPGQEQPGNSEPSQMPPGNAQQQPGQAPDGSKQPGQTQPGQAQSGQQQPGQTPSGQKSALAQSAQKLQQAAQSLSQAAQELGAGQTSGQSGSPASQSQGASNAGQQGNQSGGPPGEGTGSEGPGSQAPIPLEELEAELRRQTREDWGTLPGQLRTEILQGNKKQPGGDYARLIKLYSEELLKKQQDK